MKILLFINKRCNRWFKKFFKVTYFWLFGFFYDVYGIMFREKVSGWKLFVVCLKCFFANIIGDRKKWCWNSVLIENKVDFLGK